MLYARIVLGLPVEGPFDYIVPAAFRKKVKIGCRVWVPFRTKRLLGYVVQLTKKTSIQNLKAVTEVIDDAPLLDKNMLLLTRRLSGYYGCSWGEAIETALPESVRKGRAVSLSQDGPFPRAQGLKEEVLLIHDIDGSKRWDVYMRKIKEACGQKKSVIILVPDINSILKAKERISANLGITPVLLYRNQPQELEQWRRVKEAGCSIVIGARSSIFAPVNNLGLVIIDEEQDNVYKQDQVPHYHAREVCSMRVNIEKATLVLGSSSPSLESFYLTKKSKIQYVFIPRTRAFPEVRIIDMRTVRSFTKRNVIFSKYLEDSIISTLNSSGKTLLFLNRKGFATVATCIHCGVVLKCPRCNIHLVYHFKDKTLNCHYCNFKMPAPAICPECNAGYIRYSGLGTEKIESELSRIFPQAKIQRLDRAGPVRFGDADIFIATEAILKECDFNFDLVGILAIDNSLNRPNLRSSERTFGLLIGLLRLTEKKILIQTNLPQHSCFKALENKDINIFYDQELKQRKQLGLPPFRHIALVKLRGRHENRVREISETLFNRLKKSSEKKGNRSIKVVSVNPYEHLKLRDNFYWQVLIKSRSPFEIAKFLKINLKDFSHSGIIVTLDMDPV